MLKLNTHWVIKRVRSFLSLIANKLYGDPCKGGSAAICRRANGRAVMHRNEVCIWQYRFLTFCPRHFASVPPLSLILTQDLRTNCVNSTASVSPPACQSQNQTWPNLFQWPIKSRSACSSSFQSPASSDRWPQSKIDFLSA